MDGDGSKVQVYIYDVTKGLAAQLSPMFLGKGSYVCVYYAILLCLVPRPSGGEGTGDEATCCVV